MWHTGTRIVFWFVYSIDYVCFYLVLKTKCGLRLVCSVYQCFVSGKFRYARWQMLLLPQDGHHHLASAWEGQNMWQVDICAHSKGIKLNFDFRCCFAMLAISAMMFEDVDMFIHELQHAFWYRTGAIWLHQYYCFLMFLRLKLVSSPRFLWQRCFRC